MFDQIGVSLSHKATDHVFRATLYYGHHNTHGGPMTHNIRFRAYNLLSVSGPLVSMVCVCVSVCVCLCVCVCVDMGKKDK